MKYPYIGKGKSSGSIVLLYGEGFGLTLDSKTWATEAGKFESFIDESYFKNITREHLEGKRVKVISPEHGGFVQKLAFNAGFDWASDLEKNNLNTGVFIYFGKDGLLWVTHSAKVEEITIPLPPESSAVSEVNRDIEREVWKVGDKVMPLGRNDIVTILAIDDSTYWVKDGHGCRFELIASKALKPKTEAEILRDKLFECQKPKLDTLQATDLAKWLIENDMVKKPQ